MFNYTGPSTFQVTAVTGTTGTAVKGKAKGVIFWADVGSFFRGEKKNDPIDSEKGDEPAEVNGAFLTAGPPIQYLADGTVVYGGSQLVSSMSSYGNFGRFVAPIEDAFGRTAPIYVARDWSNSTDYLFRSLENSVTSIVLPNPTQGGDSTFELSFGNINSPTTMTLQAGVGFDFKPFYPSGVTWFSISDVTTNLSAPVDPLNPFVLGVTYADNGYSELKSWEVVAIPEPATATILVLLAVAAVARSASKKRR